MDWVLSTHLSRIPIQGLAPIWHVEHNQQQICERDPGAPGTNEGKQVVSRIDPPRSGDHRVEVEGGDLVPHSPGRSPDSPQRRGLSNSLQL